MRGRLGTREIINKKEIVEEEEEEEKICRICHGPGDSKNPLQYPCACSGSIKFVHPKCLLRWVKQQNTFQCEVCKHKYTVYRGYAKNAPTRLPLREFVGEIAVKAYPGLRLCLRYCVSVFLRLLLLPLLAFWYRRLLSLGGSEVTTELIRNYMFPSTLLMSWLYGMGYVLVSANVMAWRHGVIILREDNEDGAHVAIAPALGNENNNADEIGEHVGEDVGENVGEQQAIVDLRNAWLGLLKAPLRWVRRLMVIFFRIMFVKIDVLLPDGYLELLYCRITYDVLIHLPFPLGRILVHDVSWCFSAALSFFMPFTKSALYMENDSLKSIFDTVSAKIQNDGLLSCAKKVVAKILTVGSIGPGEALSNVDKLLLVYRSASLYNVITLATGYMVIVPLVFVCHGVPIRTVASNIRLYLRSFLTTIRYTFFLIIHLGVLPLVYGWWLDVSTIMMTGKTVSDRVEFFSKFSLLSSAMHWMVGIIYMFQMHISTSLLQRVLHKEVLYFLQDFATPHFIMFRVLTGDVQVQASQFLFSIVVNGSLIVFLVYLPVVLAIRLAPIIFPLHISVTDPFTEIPVAMLLLQICLPYAIELRETLEALLHQWVTAVCYVLGLSGFFCSRPENIGGQENVEVELRQDRLRDGHIAGQDPNTNNSTSQNFDGVENYATDAIANGYAFVLRVVLLVVLAWITLLLFSSSLVIVSLPLGRFLFSYISNLPITHGIKCNDLYAFFIGNFSIWTSFTVARYFIKHFKARKAHLRFRNMCKLFCIIVESCVLLSLWIIVIPVLIGLLFGFSFMVLVQTLVAEVPVLLLCQDWAVGFIFFKLWRTLVLLNHWIDLADEGWRIKLERVRDNDILKLPRHWMLQEILIPIIMNLLMSLCFPYVFARWIVPSLGFSQTVSSTVYWFTWVACVTIIILFPCAKRLLAWITNLHNSIRDDRYFGLWLQNFGEAAPDSSDWSADMILASW
ncbi:hypothetical protein MKW94_027456 [Papaver nudicaule]|uniref:RING-type E3 ubiquitin transferase n=1 Tax=Papaver nudicaule TaxID=74823 RepID=A0AA41V546_PAPNU|nr:hypothetical protein [Papaver nudicaule]